MLAPVAVTSLLLIPVEELILVCGYNAVRYCDVDGRDATPSPRRGRRCASAACKPGRFKPDEATNQQACAARYLQRFLDQCNSAWRGCYESCGFYIIDLDFNDRSCNPNPCGDLCCSNDRDCPPDGTIGEICEISTCTKGSSTTKCKFLRIVYVLPDGQEVIERRCRCPLSGHEHF